MKKILISALLFAFLASPSPIRAADETPPPDPYVELRKYEFGQNRKYLSMIEDQVRKAAPDQYAPIEAKLIDILKGPATSTDAAKDFACRQLMIVGSGSAVSALGELLRNGDDKTSFLARFALERMAEPSAGAALRTALGQVEGKRLAGVINSLGERRDAEVARDLEGLMYEKDSAVAAAAIRAMGKIASDDAVSALKALVKKSPDLIDGDGGAALVTAANHLAASGKTEQARDICKAVMGRAQGSKKAAALRGVILSEEPTNQAQLINTVLMGDDLPTQAAAISAFRVITDVNLRRIVADEMPKFPLNAQLLLLGSAIDQKDSFARTMALEIIQTAKDEGLRNLALDGLINLGTPDDVSFLVNLAAKSEESLAGPIRRTLERMGANGVEEALLVLAENGAPETRVTVIKVVVNRKLENALPVLTRLAAPAAPVAPVDAAVAVEAVKGIGALGTAKDLPGLATMLVETPSDEMRKAAEGSLRSICARSTDKAACSAAVLPVMEKAKTAPAQIALLKVISRIADESSLKIIRNAINARDVEVSDVAMRELADWPHFIAAQYLIDLAKSTPSEKQAILALRGANRLAVSSKQDKVSARVAIFKGILETAQRPDERKLALAGLSDLPTVEALQLAQMYLKDKALSAEASLAGVKLARGLAATYNARSIALLKELREQVTTEDAKKQADEALTFAQKFGPRTDGYITSWLMAGPYFEAGKDATAVFRFAYPPEKGDEGVAWLPAAPQPGLQPWHVALDKLMGGNDRAAYLKTTLTSDKEQEVQLEMGSDDGIKVFLNGIEVYKKNAARPMVPGSDKVKVKLKQGANTLLVKISQGGGDWAGCVRVATVDGKDPVGVKSGVAE